MNEEQHASSTPTLGRRSGALAMKIIRLLAYPIVGVLVFWFLSSNFLSGTQMYPATPTPDTANPHGGGILLSMYQNVAAYFKDAEAWNVIFLLLFVFGSMVILVLIDMVVGWVLRLIFVKNGKPSFVLNKAFQLTVQLGLSASILVALFVITSNILIISHGRKHTVASTDEIDHPVPVLVLGTSKLLRSGKGENLYYTYRIQAARELWEAGKVDFFIISGDRSGDHYDETRDMKNDLVAFGVPEEKIKLDTAGFRTLDSMLRIRQLFRTRELVIVSQEFHVQRALFLGSFYSIRGIGYNARGSSTAGMMQREAFGKPKVIMDLILFNMQPRVVAGLADGSRINYRHDFSVNSDLAVMLLVLLAIACFSSIGLMVKYID
jgi:SanA protein